MTVPLLRMWLGRQRTRGQEFLVSRPAIGQKIPATLLASPVHRARMAPIIAPFWEQPMPVGCSFGGANRLGEDHDKISTDRSSGGLVSGRSHDRLGSKWSAHGGISASAVEPESLWLLRLPSSPLRLPSSLLRLLSSLPPSSVMVSLLKETLRPPQRAAFF